MGLVIETDKAYRLWVNLPEQAPGILTEPS
jgi:hypothetical protein